MRIIWHKYVQMRRVDSACGVRQQMATVGRSRNDSIRAGADAISGADTGASNRIGPCGNSKRFRTRIGQEIPRRDAIADGFFVTFKYGGMY